MDPTIVTFKARVRALPDEEKDKHLFKASFNNLKQYLPDNINFDENYDLLPIAIDAAVINRINLNDDGATTDAALDFYKKFINKPINLEHEINKIPGFILTASITEYLTNKPITEEEVRGTLKPFNIVLGGVLWRTVSPKLCEFLENCSDPESEHYGKVLASWELACEEIGIVKIKGNSKNIEDGVLITDPEEVKSLLPNLTANKGSGMLASGEKIYRVATKALPTAVALSTSPAAENLTPVVVEPSKVEITTEKEEDKIESSNKIEQKTIESQEEISNLEKTCVKENSKIMQIKAISDITDETLPKMKASAVAEFIQDELSKAMKENAKETEKLKSEKETSQASLDKLKVDYDTLQKEVETLKANLNKFENEKAEREKNEKFSARMTSFDEKYELTADERKAIASQIKDLDDAAFTQVESNLSIFLSGKIKTAKTEEKMTASTKEVVTDAVKNAEKDKEVIPNTSTNEPTLQEKLSKAFSGDSVTLEFSR